MRQRIFDLLTHTSIEVKSIPDLTSLISGTAKITELTDIDIVDLLDRDQATPDQNLLEETIKGKTVLITGAGGSIGSELSRQIVSQDPEHLALDIRPACTTGFGRTPPSATTCKDHATYWFGSRSAVLCQYHEEVFAVNTVYLAAVPMQTRAADGTECDAMYFQQCLWNSQHCSGRRVGSGKALYTSLHWTKRLIQRISWVLLNGLQS